MGEAVPVRVCLLVESRSLAEPGPVVRELGELLEARGGTLELLAPEEELLRLDTLRPAADLYLLKSDTELAYSLATILERQGARVLNPASASQRAKDKALAATILHSAGIPCPRSFLAAGPAALGSLVRREALVLKPVRGYHGAGVMLATEPSALPHDDQYDGAVLGQAFLAGARTDLKVFVVGGDVFAVRKPFDRESYLRGGVPVPVEPAVERLAIRCGEAFGLELYGIDVAESAAGPSVIDVNPFPGYRGVPGVARRLADRILEAAACDA